MALGELICGVSGSACVANTTLDHLSSSIDRFAAKSLEFLNGEFSADTQNFGAFCARVVLENSCAALVGRLDPFRLMYLAAFQAQEDFEYGKAANSGFRWSGDVLPDDKVPQAMWGTDHNASKVSRALFSPYSDHVYWRTAIESALDAIANEGGDQFQEILLIEPESYIGGLRGRCAALYSTLSKGVHWDFFVSSIVLDEGTLKDAIREALLSLGGLGLISHFVPTAYRSLDVQSALDHYKSLRESFQ